jgi:hypothetical protein
MTIIYRAPAGRARRRAALVAASLSIGVALAWLLRPSTLDSTPGRLPVAMAASSAPAGLSQPAAHAGCDARCAVAKVFVPATTACAASIEGLAGFGLRWLDADAASPKFDQFAWLQAVRGTVTLAGVHAEFRNAAGSYLPVEYDCDFDTATLEVLEARVRPRATARMAGAAPAAR